MGKEENNIIFINKKNMNKIDRDAELHCWDMFEGGDMRSNKEIEKDASWKALHDQIPKMPRQEFRKEKDRLTDKRTAAKAYVDGYDFNESKKNMKKIVRLTEGDLHKIIKESVKRVLREEGYFTPSGGWDSYAYDYDNALEKAESLEDWDEKMRARMDSANKKANYAQKHHPEGKSTLGVSDYIHPNWFGNGDLDDEALLKHIDDEVNMSRRLYGFAAP